MRVCVQQQQQQQTSEEVPDGWAMCAVGHGSATAQEVRGRSAAAAPPPPPGAGLHGVGQACMVWGRLAWYGAGLQAHSAAASADPISQHCGSCSAVMAMRGAAARPDQAPPPTLLCLHQQLGGGRRVSALVHKHWSSMHQYNNTSIQQCIHQQLGGGRRASRLYWCIGAQALMGNHRFSTVTCGRRRTNVQHTCVKEPTLLCLPSISGWMAGGG